MNASVRTLRSQRRFSSPALNACISLFRDRHPPAIADLLENCLPNTLDTTVRLSRLDGKPDTFVITGDIDAMWLRDSTAQVWPYLALAADDAALRELLEGVIRRQTRCILIDPYANAFYSQPTQGEWSGDLTQGHPLVHERKWEIDSLAYVIRLAHGYWKATGDLSPFDNAWSEAMRAVVATWRAEQEKEGDSPYRFMRPSIGSMNTLPLDGRGYPTAPVGLIRSAFRPSDDATTLPFLIPANLFATRALRDLSSLWAAVGGDSAFAVECRAFAAEIEEAIHRHAIHPHAEFGPIYAYEIDGYGGRIFMDDANVPSLLSLSYLGCCDRNDPVYRATRAFVLSPRNPWFFRGIAAEGVGSPHTGMGRIWPIALAMRALTSDDDGEITACLRMLAATTAGTGLMHEAFDRNDPSAFTRTWFAWANSLFGELLLVLDRERPHLLQAFQ